jgi:1-acyl-sn-glycerol-3-phosphate acyltransferase
MSEYYNRATNMLKVWLKVITLWGYFLIGIIMAICFIPCTIIACLPKAWRYDNSFYYWVTHIFYKAIVIISRVPVSVTGKDNIPKAPAILIANHESSLDIPLLGSIVDGHPHVWLFLARFAKVPIFGFIVRRMNVVVDYSGLRKLVGSLEETLQIIKERKSHVLLFPEGGRYIDNKIHKFLYGFAVLAKRTGRPVVPVLMKNVGKVYPPSAFWIARHPISITIGEPFYFKPDETDDEFVLRVRDWFVQRAT